MSLLKKLAGQTAIYGLSHIVSRVLLFVIFTIYLTRKVGEAEYGIYADMYSYATVILTILVFRMDTAMFRFGREKQDAQKVFNTGFIGVLIFSLIALLLLLPLVGPIANLLQYNQSPHYIRWFAYFLVLDALAALVFARLRLQNRPVRFVVYKLLNILLTVVFVLFFLEFMPKYFPDIYNNLTLYLGINRRIDFVFFTNLIASGAVLLAMIPEFSSFRFEFDYSIFKKMAWYALPLVFVGIAGNINQAFAAPLQRIFLGEDILDNLAYVGVYAAAAKLAILLNLFTTAFNYAAEPFFFNNADNKDSLKVYGKVALAFTIVACFAALVLIFYIDIITLLLGEKYKSGVNVVPILLFAYIFLGLYYNVSIWYKLKDKTHIGAYISTLGAFVTIVVSIILLPRLGTIASAWAALACYITMVIVGYSIGQKYYPIKYPVKKISGYILTSLLLALVAIYSRHAIGVNALYFIGVSVTLVTFLYTSYRLEWKEMTK